MPVLILMILAAVAAFAPASASAGERLSVGGASIDWPAAAEQGFASPGQRIQVEVVRNRSGRKAVVTLERVDGARRLVARRALRRGTFSARLAQQAGARYLLRLRIGKARREARFSVRSPTACTFGAPASAKLTIGAASARAGEYVPATLANLGTTCIESGLKLEWEARQADGSYVAIEPPGPVTLESYTLAPGARRDFQGFVWSNLQPGEYRAVLRVTSGDDVFAVTAGPFTIVP